MFIGTGVQSTESKSSRSSVKYVQIKKTEIMKMNHLIMVLMRTGKCGSASLPYSGRVFLLWNHAMTTDAVDVLYFRDYQALE
jgi:hypothetical protein